MKRHAWLAPDIYQGKGYSEKAALKMKLESNHTSVTIQNPPHLDLEVVKTPPRAIRILHCNDTFIGM
jgi:hypothetical protein